MKLLKEHKTNVQEVLIILMQRCFSEQAKEEKMDIFKYINTGTFFTYTYTLKTYSETKDQQHIGEK